MTLDELVITLRRRPRSQALKPFRVTDDEWTGIYAELEERLGVPPLFIERDGVVGLSVKCTPIVADCERRPGE